MSLIASELTKEFVWLFVMLMQSFGLRNTISSMDLLLVYMHTALRVAGLPGTTGETLSYLTKIINVQHPNSCLPGQVIKALVVHFAHPLVPYYKILPKNNEDGPPLLPVCPV